MATLRDPHDAKRRRGRISAARAGAAAVALAAVVATGCGSAASRAPAPFDAIAARAVAGAPVCEATGAHERHAQLGVSCTECHPCGGGFGFTAATGTIMRLPGQPISCSVSCHRPRDGSFDVPVPDVSWAGGPLACGGCHVGKMTAMLQAASSHPVATTADVAGNRASCEACHATTRHGLGVVYVAGPDGPAVPATASTQDDVDRVCASCHDGAGKAMLGRTPPKLVGYGTGGLDAHGAAGAQPALHCSSCHDPHASGNAFLLRAAAATPIDRVGTSSVALCRTCHATRHTGCTADCHSHTSTFATFLHAGDPVADSKSCLWCHGHEGSRNIPPPKACGHCHDAVWLALAPLRIGLEPTVTTTATMATITWSTNNAASSWVEYGLPGQRDLIVGNEVLSFTHSVTLPSLAAGTTYEYRVRSADQARSTAFSALARFTPGGPQPPTPIWGNDLFSSAPTAEIELRWNPITLPGGHAVEYAVQVSESSMFDGATPSPWVSGSSYVARIVMRPESGKLWYWRVMARDAVVDSRSSWSTVANFRSFPFEMDPE